MARVMIIDPDKTTLAALQTALGKAGFADVLAVTSGSFALTMLERNRPDLIVSRVGVPDIDGYELCSIAARQRRSRLASRRPRLSPKSLTACAGR